VINIDLVVFDELSKGIRCLEGPPPKIIPWAIHPNLHRFGNKNRTLIFIEITCQIQ
jgi:hypothetical protein